MKAQTKTAIAMFGGAAGLAMTLFARRSLGSRGDRNTGVLAGS